jgi:hypothetical protein
MKTKLLFSMLYLFFALNVNAQNNSSDNKSEDKKEMTFYNNKAISLQSKYGCGYGISLITLKSSF